MNMDEDSVNREINSLMGEIQMKDVVRTFNSLVERCFHGCVKDFKTRSLTDQEELCTIRCSDKFLKHSAKVSRVFAEQSVLQAEQQNNN